MAKEKKKNFVEIKSNANITVTAGLLYDNVTNEDAHVPDRLKVNSQWAKLNVDIVIGSNWYPSEIVEWPTVQALVRDKVIMIGQFSDTPDGEIIKNKDDLQRELKEVSDKIRDNENNFKDYKGKATKDNDLVKSLNDIVGD